MVWSREAQRYHRFEAPRQVPSSGLPTLEIRSQKHCSQIGQTRRRGECDLEGSSLASIYADVGAPTGNGGEHLGVLTRTKISPTFRTQEQASVCRAQPTTAPS